MTRLIALDTETTGLDEQSERIFEVAAVDIATDREWVWTIQPPPDVVDNMHPKAAEVNRYHERTASDGWQWDIRWHPYGYDAEETDVVLDAIRDVLDGAHIIGAVPDFDTTRFLTALYRRWMREVPRWHYHLIDVEVMAVGALHAEADALTTKPGAAKILRDAATPPYESDQLAAFCGVRAPSGDERHTALGDARWVARWYRTLTGTEVVA